MSRFGDLLIVDSHPVQYRVPVYREVARLLNSEGAGLRVIYGSDSSVRGAIDSGFGRAVVWDEPMLDGYVSEFLPQAANSQPGKFSAIDGHGIGQRIRDLRPKSVFLNGIGYRMDARALIAARLAGLPTWLRSETQDVAYARGPVKSMTRAAIYRTVYAQFDHFFPIGEANAAHYRAHGVPSRKFTYARYCTVDRFPGDAAARLVRGNARRRELGFSADRSLLLFCGKFIPKKNPAVIFAALRRMPEDQRIRYALLFVGTGDQEEMLRREAASMPEVETVFAGFVNQSQIADYYLASDGLILPSLQMGETWGLVVNESLLAGKPVILSRHAGSSLDMARFPGVKVVDPNAEEVAMALEWLPSAPRGDALRENMRPYSIAAAAEAISTEFLTRFASGQKLKSA